MLIEITEKDYKNIFPKAPNPFLKPEFLLLNAKKVENLIWLVNDDEKPSVGIVLGKKNNELLSPFSAPFGGVHYKNENVYISVLDSFAKSLKGYCESSILDIKLSFPPSIYGHSFNSKMINSLIRNGFLIQTPELTNWVDLQTFQKRFSQKNSREYLNQAVRNNLVFTKLYEYNDYIKCFEVLVDNRKRQGRPVFMDLNQVLETEKLWPIDFFGVYDVNKNIIASAIVYQFEKTVAFAALWGDTEKGRRLRAMDFLSFNLWSHYKNEGFSVFDLGKSTVDGLPNEGLLRFKETHECVTELRFSLSFSF